MAGKFPDVRHQARRLCRVFSFLLRSLARYPPPMPRDAFTLSDVRDPTLTIACEPCGRRGRYSIAQLIERHGDAKLIESEADNRQLPKGPVLQHL